MTIPELARTQGSQLHGSGEGWRYAAAQGRAGGSLVASEWRCPLEQGGALWQVNVMTVDAVRGVTLLWEPGTRGQDSPEENLMGGRVSGVDRLGLQERLRTEEVRKNESGFRNLRECWRQDTGQARVLLSRMRQGAG